LQASTDLTPFLVWVVASGSLPLSMPADFYARLACLCRERDTKLVLETTGPALAAAMAEGVYLVKPNLGELSELVGQPLESPAAWRAAAQGLIDQGAAQVVALTLGHLGAVLVTREGLWCADPLPVPVVSAVGAGDSFVGGMVWALQQDRTRVDAFAWGVAAGSATLLTAGTALCRAEDVQRLRTQVVISAPTRLSR
jgi:6-phosphofructokinase 2